jgi:DNA-directed RNA polymerase specialized sigma24 family protein
MPTDNRQPAPAADRRVFATTRWSVVISAGRDSSADARQALAALCETYWYPLYAYVRRRVPDADQAQDLTQSFLCELIEKNYVGTATPDRGRFRAFLLTAFKHFLARQWEKARAKKRGGGRKLLSLDFQSADSRLCIQPAAGLTAEQFYDQQWAITLLQKILDRLESELVQNGKARQFAELKGFLIGDHAGTNYAQVAVRLQMTETAAKKAASRMRRRYRELLAEEIAHTVSSPDEINDEIRNLFASTKNGQ